MPGKLPGMLKSGIEQNNDEEEIPGKSAKFIIVYIM